MMGWAIVLGLLGVSLAGIIGIGRLPRATWELVAAALILGLAGYAWQGRPNLAGSPRSVQAKAANFDEKLVERRRSMEDRFGDAAQWLILSDGLARQGKTREAANVLVSGLRQSPDDPNLWAALGNALVAHGNGVLSPSADFAYRRAMTLDPAKPAAPYFYGIALIRSGQMAEARPVWAALAAQLPIGSGLRTELEEKLIVMDRLLAAQQQGGQ
ncbi:tetratricopeptide repeat protein [Sphingobium phenoxybenzoativorans]|uniref:tetratricopeptide repeat protein n=1 Tax=Sphingobium phenoxybenzoativorans TaxID=1592790 RepID=UPI000871FA50